jgi:hypothetical protein
MTNKSTSLSSSTAYDPTAVPPAESIRRQTNRILASPEFRATNVQKSFLTFVVETVLAGQSHEIKGYTVATQVFSRGQDFNQATDPIVSIQANKLQHLRSLRAVGRLGPAGSIRKGIRGNPVLQSALIILGSVAEDC